MRMKITCYDQGRLIFSEQLKAVPINITQIIIQIDRIGFSQNPMKHYKLHVQNVIGIDVEGLNFSTALVEVKQTNGKILKVSPLNHISHTNATFDASGQIKISFSLFQQSNLGSRAPRVFAEGTISIQCKQFQKQQKITLGCTLRHVVSKKAVITIVLTFKQDLEKITYLIPQSEQSYFQSNDQQQQKSFKIDQSVIAIEHQSHKPSPMPSPRVQPPKVKNSPSKRPSKKPIRARHFQYMVKNQSSNVQIKNKVTDQYNIFFENLKIDIDQAISSIQFYGNSYQQLLAQVMFKTNPSQQELRKLKIKVPQDEKVIDIHLKTLQGQKLSGSAQLPDLNQNQCLRLQCDFKDENKQVKAKMKFNYKQEQNYSNKQPQRMQMSQKVNMFEKKNKLKNQLQFLPSIFLQTKQRSTDSPRLKLPKILSKEQSIKTQTVNEKILSIVDSTRTDKSARNGMSSRRSSSKQKNYQQKQQNQKRNSKKQHALKEPIKNRQFYASQVLDPNIETLPHSKSYMYGQPHNHNINRNSKNEISLFGRPIFDDQIRGQSEEEDNYPRGRTVLSKNNYRIHAEPTLTSQSSMKTVVKILSISVKFYNNYLQKNQVRNERELNGKFLQIFSSYSNIYRTQSIFSPRILSWSLKKCEISMNQYDNLTFQLNHDKQNNLIGQLIISYNQLKYNDKENSLYFGYLTKNEDMIAKISIEYKLISGDRGGHLADRLSNLDKTERRPRIRRLYSQDINFTNNQELSRKSPNKLNYYESSVPLIPEISKRNLNNHNHNYRICEQHRQTEHLKEGKRKRLLSIGKNERYHY